MAYLTAAANQLIVAVLVTACAPTIAHDERGRGGSAGEGRFSEAGADTAGRSNEAGADTAGRSNEAGAGSADAGCGTGGSTAGCQANAAGSAGSAHDSEAGAAGRNPEDSAINGVDFAVWDRYLGIPIGEESALGIDNDPSGVYSIVTLDGEPAIRISGEVWGSLISKQEFCNFRLRAEYKWGSAIWPPLYAKDSGIMFLSTGPLGAVNQGGNPLSDPIGSGGFMVSAEYQIAPGNVSTLYNLGPVAFNSEYLAERTDSLTGWNSVEISLIDDHATMSLNGRETVRGSGFTLNWPGESSSALRCGKLQLESEGAEIFFRRFEIEPLP